MSGDRAIRIPPQAPPRWSEATRAVFGAVDPVPAVGDGPTARPLHLPAVVAHHERLLGPYMAWATAVARGGVLAPRDSALLALRTALRCGSDFEWGVHAASALSRAGLSDDDVARVARGPDAAWSTRDAALIRAADELHDIQAVSDATWDTLARSFATDALLEIVFVVGHYTMLAMVANSAGVQPEATWPRLPQR